MIIYFIFALLIALVAVIFALQNTAQITVSILFWNVTSSLAFILMVTIIAGVMIGFLVASPTIVREKWNVRRHRKKVNELEANLAVHKAKLGEAEAKIATQAPQTSQPSLPASVPPPAPPANTPVKPSEENEQDL